MPPLGLSIVERSQSDVILDGLLSLLELGQVHIVARKLHLVFLSHYIPSLVVIEFGRHLRPDRLKLDY